MEELDVEVDDETAAEIAVHIVDEAVHELKEAGATDEQVGENIISTALFDLTEREMVAIQEMEDEIIEEEIDLVEIADASEDPEVVSAAEAKLKELD